MKNTYCDACSRMGDKRRALFHEQGLDLIVWYEKKDGMLTVYSDPRVAAELGWFPRTRHDGQPSRADELHGTGDGNRVRAVRRQIDRCRCLFDGYTFGTKSNGAGQHVSRLHKRDAEAGTDELGLHFGEVIARTKQAVDQQGAEFERVVAALQEMKTTYVNLGEFEKAFCADHALRDIEEHRVIQPSTVAEAQRLGIPIPRVPA